MAETKFQIISDLHLETPGAYDTFHIEPKAPYLALLGDIGCVKDDGLFSFIRKQLEIFRIVLFVFGNHEPYHSSWTEAKSRIKHFKADLASHEQSEILGEFVLLDRTRYDISPTLSILGCTLFSQVLPEQKESVSYRLNDFYYIDHWSVEAHQDAHHADLEWLNHEIDSISRLEPDRKVVVLTHYCPSTSKNVTDPKHEHSNISSAFMTDLSREICWKQNAVKLWAFGHTHFNCDFWNSTHNMRVISNQRGYYFDQAIGFDGCKIIEI